MAITLINNIYPPIMDTYMPSFIKENGCKVYFNLSSYNNIEYINQYVQISLRYQINNQNALKKYLYPLEIALKEIQQDEKGYYIKIDAEDCENNTFTTNTYYKVQIRFMSKEVPIISNKDISTYWLNQYLNYFSEWSKVCLIKGISNPKFDFTYFDTDTSKEVVLTNNSFSQIVGKMYFESKDNINEKEYLKSYDIKIYSKAELDKDKNADCKYDSGVLFPEDNDSMSINHNILYSFNNKTHYLLYFHYITNNLYEDTLIMKFYTSNLYEDKIGDIFKCELEEADARIRIDVDLKTINRNNVDVSQIFNSFGENIEKGGLIIRRSSNKDDFKYWEDIKKISADDIIKFQKYCEENKIEPVFSLYDYTIESGIMYKYALQSYNGKEQRGNLHKFGKVEDGLRKDGVWMCDMEDIFLTTRDRQLKIEFNPQISSFSKYVAESKTDTIGSKYPLFYRNGVVNYKTFPISGLISCLSDENSIFFNKEKFFSNSVLIGKDSVNNLIYDKANKNKMTYYNKYYDLYNQFNNNKEIQFDRDYIFEKFFRDEVMNFLTDGEVKLFRSETEGNILVRLMNVSFTPNQTLGRMVYSFSATAYEIDECNFENYNKYNIHSIDNQNTDYSNYSTTDTSLLRIGELDFIAGDKSLKTILSEKYSYTVDDLEYSLGTIDWVKIYFEGSEGPIGRGGIEQTQLIVKDENKLRIIDSADDVDEDTQIYLGFLIKVNNEQIFISRWGIYTIEDNSIKIEDISFEDMVDRNIQVKLIYRVTLNRKQKENINDKITKYYFSTNASQTINSFMPGEKIIDKIKSITNISTEMSKQELLTLKKMYIEADPCTYFTINNNNFYMNESGQLWLDKTLYNIDDLTFIGYKLIKNISEKQPKNLRFEEFYVKTGNYKEADILQLDHFAPNVAYPIENNKYIIYYKDGWYNIDIETGIVKCPATILINYNFELERGGLN